MGISVWLLVRSALVEELGLSSSMRQNFTRIALDLGRSARWCARADKDRRDAITAQLAGATYPATAIVENEVYLLDRNGLHQPPTTQQRARPGMAGIIGATARRTQRSCPPPPLPAGCGGASPTSATVRASATVPPPPQGTAAGSHRCLSQGVGRAGSHPQTDPRMVRGQQVAIRQQCARARTGRSRSVCRARRIIREFHQNMPDRPARPASLSPIGPKRSISMTTIATTGMLWPPMSRRLWLMSWPMSATRAPSCWCAWTNTTRRSS